MITHDEKGYLYDRLDSVIAALTDIVQEMSKWATETPINNNEGNIMNVQESNSTMYEGHAISVKPSFDGKSMKYQWILKDTRNSFVVMQHDTLDEAKATIDQYVEGELI